LVVTQHEYRAMGIRGAMLTDRTKQHSNELSMATTADR
jgi:hypothetical protein